MHRLCLLLMMIAFYPAGVAEAQLESAIPRRGALDGVRPRVVVSTDIGGTDPDDFQSMVHLLLYADVLDLEGLISSPYGPGRAGDIQAVIDCYAADLKMLTRHSSNYPTPAQLRAITKQGETQVAPYAGYRRSTEGSRWLVSRARQRSQRPLNVLVWGGLEDLAQALHDAPDILPRLRVYWIGGPNKKWSPDAYQYIATHHPKLWMIECNASYRGFFLDSDRDDEWGKLFVKTHMAGNHALGAFFANQLGDFVKMGDTPSVTWLLKGDSADPAASSWGGRFVHAWKRPHVIYERMPTSADQVQQFTIVEIQLPVENWKSNSSATLDVENQRLRGDYDGEGTVRFRFCPKASKRYAFTISSDLPSLHGIRGEILAVVPSVTFKDMPDKELPNWWTDNPSPDLMTEGHIGTRTVSRWREDMLSNFAQRMLRADADVAPDGQHNDGR